jgi:hypothetical protein
MAPATCSAGLKLERAKKHRADLETAISAFMSSSPYTVGALRPEIPHSPSTASLSSKRSRQTFRWFVETFLLQNLRSAVDHLAGQLAISAGNDIGKHTAFPIFENAIKYKSGASKKVERMRADAIRAIGALEPYGGGKVEALWRLHQLNNIDKHRVIFTAASSVAAVPKDKCFPLQVGSILFVHRERFQIKISDWDPLPSPSSQEVYGEPVLQVITGLTTAVENVLGTLAPFL